MRPPLWIDVAAGERERARWATLSDEQKAKECGLTLEAYQDRAAAYRAMGRNLGESLNRATKELLMRTAKGKP